jgi:peptidoglycan/LPS O-acetylase OafA/YrhL
VALGPFARARAFNHNPVWREYSYLGGMDAIALGCLTALIVAGHTLPRWAYWTAKVSGIALMVFSLCFSIQAYKWGLGRNGLNMTILAVGTCLVIAAAAQSKGRERGSANLLLSPLLLLGRRSYEIYLTHVFLVLGLFSIFVAAGKPMWGVPVLFVLVIACAGILGALVGRFYCDPINRWLRARWSDGAKRLGSVVEGE